MSNNEQAVRDAAEALKTAINEARAAGYRVDWPGNSDGLDRISISATDAVVEDVKPRPFGVMEPPGKQVSGSEGA